MIIVFKNINYNIISYYYIIVNYYLFAIYKFKDLLIKKGLITTLRITRGDAIDGACGQLVGKLTKSIKGKNKTSTINLINTS